MGKVVRMVARILTDRCTGCALCVYVCPTIAISLRPRRDDEPGPGRKVAELIDASCYNAQNCLEMCPDEAIVMERLGEPFTVGTDPAAADPDRVKDLCRSAGIGPKQLICMCAEVTGAELAASILLGAATPEAVSLATGARTGCTELCHQPILALLAAAGHGDAPHNPPRGLQWYGLAGKAIDILDGRGEVPLDVLASYSGYRLESDLRVMQGDFSEWAGEESE